MEILPQSEHWRAGIQFLARGDYELGWRLYETRPRARFTKLKTPEWDGSPISSLIILPEQGFGDQILFARYAPFLRSRGVEVFLFCEPRLARLFGSLGVNVVAAEGLLDLPKADAWAFCGSLPYRCGTTLETIPPAPYLRADPRPRGGTGVMATGNKNLAEGLDRHPPPELAAELLSLPGAVDLSPEATGARDFLDTAEIIAGLDRVVTVDTSVANLAGALGVETYVMLPQHADWRWMEDGAASPWYPSARLVRQPTQGDWRSVVDHVGALLQAKETGQTA